LAAIGTAASARPAAVPIVDTRGDHRSCRTTARTHTDARRAASTAPSPAHAPHAHQASTKK
jgi:hypothetical protein